MLKIKNLSQVNKDIDNWLAQVEAEIEAVARGYAMQALGVLEIHSAQYSGDFAANWNLSVGTPDTSFAPWPGRHEWTDKNTQPFLMGDAPAMDYAMARAAGSLDSFKLGQTIWLTNAAFHNESYAEKIENNRINFRPGNDGMPIFHTVEMMKMNYATIKKGAAAQLKGLYT